MCNDFIHLRAVYFYYNDLQASDVPRTCRRSLCFPVSWSVHDLMFLLSQYLSKYCN